MLATIRRAKAVVALASLWLMASAYGGTTGAPEMKNRKFGVRTVILIAVLALVAAACGDDDVAETTGAPETTLVTSLVEAAADEGTIAWYTGASDLDTAEGIAALFTETYGIPVDLFHESSGTVHQRFNQEASAGIATADVVSLSAPALFELLKDEGHLDQYSPINSQHLVEGLQGVDPDEMYHATSVFYMVIGYNTELVTEEEAPRTWEELLDPKWANNNLAISHPGASGSAGIWTVHMELTYGPDYMEGLADQDPFVTQGGDAAVAQVARGEQAVGVVSDFGPRILASTGQPIAIIYPEDGATIVPTFSAVAESAPHPNAARLFLEFMMTPEVSEFYAANHWLPIRGDVPVAPGVQDPGNIVSDAPTLDENQEHLVPLIERFRELFGI